MLQFLARYLSKFQKTGSISHGRIFYPTLAWIMFFLPPFKQSNSNPNPTGLQQPSNNQKIPQFQEICLKNKIRIINQASALKGKILFPEKFNASLIINFITLKILPFYSLSLSVQDPLHQ